MGSSVVEELAFLSQSVVPLAEFRSRFLDCLKQGTGALGVWLWQPSGLNSMEVIAAAKESDEQQAGELSVRRQRCRTVVEAGRCETAAGFQDNRSNNAVTAITYVPIWTDSQLNSVLEVVHGANASSTTSDTVRLLKVACELAAGFLVRHELRHLRSEAVWTNRLHAFVSDLHLFCTLDETGYFVANEGRRLLECDRLSVAVRTGKRCRVIAVSGQDRVQRRANAVRSLERLASQYLVVGEPIVYPLATELPLQLQHTLDVFLEESRAKSVALLPLVPRRSSDQLDEPNLRPLPSSTIVGVLIVEMYRNDFQEEFHSRAAMSIAPCAIALDNAMRHQRIFLLPLWRALGSVWALLQLRTLPKTAAAVLLVVGFVLGLLMIGADFELAAEGSLEPEIRQHIFALSDGVVEDVRVREGSPVKAGEQLASMRNTELNFRLEQLAGEIQTTTKKLLAVKAARLAVAPTTSAEQTRYYQLAAEEEELTEWQKSLEKQRELRLRQKSQLAVLSPIDGEVVTWNVEELLSSRPVTLGQTLMTVARLDGPWVLELLMPDRRVGHFLKAQEKESESLGVSFILATEPQRVYHGRVKKVAQSMALDERQGQSLRVTVEVNREELQVHQPGAAVVARIHCGRRSVGYVWFHEIGEFLQLHVLFRWGFCAEQ